MELRRSVKMGEMFVDDDDDAKGKCDPYPAIIASRLAVLHHRSDPSHLIIYRSTRPSSCDTYHLSFSFSTKMSAQQYFNGQSGQKGYQEMNNGGYNNYGQQQQQQQQPYYAPPFQGYPQNGQQYMPPLNNSVPPVTAMHSSQPYAEPQYAANMNADIAGKANPAQAEHRFKPKKKLNDPVFLILFLAVFAGMIVVAALAIRQFVKYNGGNGGFGDGGQGGTGISTSLN
jgi:hypothetical protein